MDFCTKQLRAQNTKKHKISKNINTTDDDIIKDYLVSMLLLAGRSNLAGQSLNPIPGG
jgi:hypothetical protein